MALAAAEAAVRAQMQDDIQGFFAQAVWSHCAKHSHPRYTVPLLLNGHFATVKDQGNQFVALAQIHSRQSLWHMPLHTRLYRL
jgi:hypothetical protein